MKETHRSSWSEDHRILTPNLFWSIREEIPRSLNWQLMAASMLLPLLVWAFISSLGVVEPLFLPSPIEVVQAIGRLWSADILQKDIAYSIFRVFSGFALAVLISVPLGVLMGTFASIRAMMEPAIAILRYMPAPAFIPLLILYFGLGEVPKVLLIFIGTLFFNTLMIMDAVKFVPKELIETTYTLGGNRKQVLLKVILPHVLPGILDASRVNMAASWNLVIVAELVAATEGLGRRISVAQRFLRTDEIFAGLLVIGLIGLAIDLLFRLALKLCCSWTED
ncbi:ABC transporter permease [Sodalinema gerasimenkoae]|uniref:ABC transporter permease n=1 Tax=Sodalinema gerasimenkoae TaxID=2862348 RepID=UPI00135C834C|nr:ABC transporter permease [Sodalinema gerasimenkoae]